VFWRRLGDMFTIAPAAAEGSWMLAEALLRCSSVRERLDRALADLVALSVDCAWRARAVEAMLDRCAEQQHELARVLDELGWIESGLRAG
jgi:site-specific recombinase